MSPSSFAVLLLSLASLLLWGQHARADSPLTSIDLTLAYADSTNVARAMEAGLDERVCSALVDPSLSFGERAAVVAALGWSVTGQNHASVLLEHLAQQRGRKADTLRLDELGAEEAFALGFLLAMDDYLRLRPMGRGTGELHLATPFELLAVAQKKAPQSYTVALASALVQAQEAMHRDWCEVYRLVNSVAQSFEAERDLREDAERSVLEYVASFRSECIHPRPVSGP